MSLYDSAELLSVIQQRGSVPVNAGSWDNASLLRTASEVVRTWHLPLLIQAKGEYLVKETQMACVAGQREYLLGPRAAAVRLLSLISANKENQLDEMTPRAQSELGVDRTRRATPRYYSFREGYAQLYPLPANTSDSLKVLWHIRPSRIVVTTDCWQITAITPATPDATHTQLGFGGAATAAVSGAAGTLYDFVGVRNPFPIKGFDAPSTATVTVSVSTTAVFLTSSIPSDLAVGDWVAAAGYTPMPNVVEELHTAVALRTAAVAVQSRQSKLATALNAEANAIERNLLNGVLAPRSRGNPQRLAQRRWMR